MTPTQQAPQANHPLVLECVYQFEIAAMSEKNVVKFLLNLLLECTFHKGRAPSCEYASLYWLRKQKPA